MNGDFKIIVWSFVILIEFCSCAKALPFMGGESRCVFTPHVCPNENITFHLYTKDTQKTPTELNMNDIEGIKKANFAPNVPLVILLHGYTGHKDFAPNNFIRPAYFRRGERNIISVDYGKIVPEPCYIHAVYNLQTVANCTAQLINFMVDENMFGMEDIHIIGFSLGAQTAGMIANYITPGRKLARVTALDPAKPMFVTATGKNRLDQYDAEFVDVIHTDVFQRGVLFPTGHVDFFVNGGFDQPGCGAAESPGSCNHDRAPQYYAESINSKRGFWGYRCGHWYLHAVGLCTSKNTDSIAIMGYKAKNDTRGQYFLTTNSQRPYARGRNFTTPLVLPSASAEKSEYDEDYTDEDDDYIYEYDYNKIL